MQLRLGDRNSVVTIKTHLIVKRNYLLKKLIIAIAAIGLLAGPASAAGMGKSAMHKKMVHMMMMLKQESAHLLQMERALQNMMDNESSSTHHG